jgi:hypothetical protein
MLERKIDNYNRLVAELMTRREIATQSLIAFRSDFFDAANLRQKLDAELDHSMKEIDRISFPQTWKSAGEQASKRARESAVAAHAALAEKERQEAIAMGANKKHAHFDDDEKSLPQSAASKKSN